MKKYFTLIFSTLLITSLTACTSYITMNSTAFYQQDFPRKGTVLVMAANPKQNASLEFSYYKPQIEATLTSHGYQVTQNHEDAQIVALISYGIDHGTTKTINQPVYGYSNFMYGDRYNRYAMPQYSIVGVTTTQTTEYTRALALDFVQAQSLRDDGEPKKLYENRVKSTGACANLNQVFSQMLAGMFRHFPGENGKTEIVNIEGDDC